MWNPEASDSSPIIFTFMSSWERTKMPRCQGGGGQDGACGREPLLDDWMSWSWSRGSRCGAITSVRSPLPHSPGRRGKRCRPRRLEGGEQGVPERSNPLRWRSSLQDSERSRKNRSIRGFRLLSYICISAKFFLSSALPGICVHFQFLGVAEWVLTGGEARVAGPIHLATASGRGPKG
jgi:hypothetical protein